MSDKIYGNPESYFKDFCPLCGYRFYGDTPDEVYGYILQHLEDGTCEKNWRAMGIALHDTGDDLRR